MLNLRICAVCRLAWHSGVACGAVDVDRDARAGRPNSSGGKVALGARLRVRLFAHSGLR